MSKQRLVPPCCGSQLALGGVIPLLVLIAVETLQSKKNNVETFEVKLTGGLLDAQFKEKEEVLKRSTEAAWQSFQRSAQHSRMVRDPCQTLLLFEHEDELHVQQIARLPGE